MVVKITSIDFEKYKKICDDFLVYLKKQKCSSIHDVHIILKIISGFPYCLDMEGHYSYKGKFYNSMNELPLEGLNDLLCRLKHGGTL